MAEPYDLVCLSHLRWDFVFQRPQHLMSRGAKERRVFFIEEPIFDADAPHLTVSVSSEGVHVAVPHLPHSDDVEVQQKALLGAFFAEQNIERYVLWYYTPMALGWIPPLTPLATVYDCMDELSAFHGAPPVLVERERELFGQADLVFTGGQSLYEAKRTQHAHVFPFPSSVDVPHFAQARQASVDPEDQRELPHPRLGFFGVIDERLDLELLDSIACLRPDWQWIILGPVVKIDEATLPRHANIHYLGGKKYAELPSYLAHWDAALLLFARNKATRFISPTKTPEYLAAGRPVVSTSIRDVVRPYGEQELVAIADTPEAFVAACEAALTENNPERQARVEAFLAGISWDRTWRQMADLIGDRVAQHDRNTR